MFEPIEVEKVPTVSLDEDDVFYSDEEWKQMLSSGVFPSHLHWAQNSVQAHPSRPPSYLTQVPQDAILSLRSEFPPQLIGRILLVKTFKAKCFTPAICLLAFLGAFLITYLPGWYQARQIRAETARKWEVTIEHLQESQQMFWQRIEELDAAE